MVVKVHLLLPGTVQVLIERDTYTNLAYQLVNFKGGGGGWDDHPLPPELNPVSLSRQCPCFNCVLSENSQLYIHTCIYIRKPTCSVLDYQ